MPVSFKRALLLLSSVLSLSVFAEDIFEATSEDLKEFDSMLSHQKGAQAKVRLTKDKAKEASDPRRDFDRPVAAGLPNKAGTAPADGPSSGQPPAVGNTPFQALPPTPPNQYTAGPGAGTGARTPPPSSQIAPQPPAH